MHRVHGAGRRANDANGQNCYISLPEAPHGVQGLCWKLVASWTPQVSSVSKSGSDVCGESKFEGLSLQPLHHMLVQREGALFQCSPTSHAAREGKQIWYVSAESAGKSDWAEHGWTVFRSLGGTCSSICCSPSSHSDCKAILLTSNSIPMDLLSGIESKTFDGTVSEIFFQTKTKAKPVSWVQASAAKLVSRVQASAVIKMSVFRAVAFAVVFAVAWQRLWRIIFARLSSAIFGPNTRWAACS